MVYITKKAIDAYTNACWHITGFQHYSFKISDTKKISEVCGLYRLEVLGSRF